MAGFPTLTLTLDRVILHTVMHHSSTSTCTPNFIEMEETFCGRTNVGHVIDKLALYGTDGRLFATDVSAKFKVT